MPHNLPFDVGRLANYLAGECTPRQRQEVEAWLAEEPENREMLRNLTKIWDGVRHIRHETVNVDAAVQTIERYAARTPGELSVRDVGPRWHRLYRFYQWRAAAVLLVVVGLIASMRLVGPFSPRSDNALGPYHHYVTGNGHQAKVTLADGSTVTLGNATMLVVSPEFGTRDRHVIVRGEAWFNVTSNQAAPFIVQGGNASVRVLGTSFLVRKHPSDAVTRVLVSEGKVSVRALREGEPPTKRLDVQSEAILVPHTLAQVSDSGQIIVKPGVVLDDYMGWLKQQIVFRETTLAEAIPEIERAYDVTITVTDSSLLKRRITLTASVKERSVTNVMNLLAPAVEAKYTRSGNQIVLSPAKYQKPVPATRYKSVPSLEKT